MKTSIALTLLFLAGMLRAQDTIRLYSIVPNSKPTPNGEKNDTRPGGIAWLHGVSVPEMRTTAPISVSPDRASFTNPLSVTRSCPTERPAKTTKNSSKQEKQRVSKFFGIKGQR